MEKRTQLDKELKAKYDALRDECDTYVISIWLFHTFYKKDMRMYCK